ncbi:hypothetical protein MWU60_13435 [Yoonia sp. F2084L]|uniref:COG4315 family predicted lipoprotein n=1 Tax=Yoonia sp. F2084L TaxID=2926419 RepID=UPI001FF624E8|nr:hypothetical protein [Yoonia sp. F2084L]MCK0096578.1 hypothetical protein [Yoonia sp. F2084L]
MKLIAAISAGLFVAACDEAYAQSYDYSYDTKPSEVTLAAGHGPLTAANGMTLYTFDNDAAGVSNCYDSCAESWPPYLVEAGAAPGEGFTQVARNDGTSQWAKDGAPLYFWVGDAAPGDTTGDGVGGVWHIAK